MLEGRVPLSLISMAFSATESSLGVVEDPDECLGFKWRKSCEWTSVVNALFQCVFSSVTIHMQCSLFLYANFHFCKVSVLKVTLYICLFNTFI